jgi:hypothetical protein
MWCAPAIVLQFQQLRSSLWFVMLLITLNAAFGAGFFFFAIRAVRQGWPFFKHGWLMVQTSAPDFQSTIERRGAISEGGRFLIGGTLWMAAGLGSFLAAFYFTIQAWNLLYNAPPV